MYRVLNEDVCFLVSLSNVIGSLKKKEALFMHSHSSHMDERLLKRLFEAYSNDLFTMLSILFALEKKRKRL